MASQQAEYASYKEEFEAQAGKGPEYDFPTTAPDATIPVVNEADLQPEAAPQLVAGEDAPELTEDEIAKEEELEAREFGGKEWSEDLAQNNPQPGEGPDLLLGEDDL